MTDYQPDWYDFLDEYDTAGNSEVNDADKLGDSGDYDSGSAGHGGFDSMRFDFSCEVVHDPGLTLKMVRAAVLKMREQCVLPWYDESGKSYYLLDDGCDVIDARVYQDGDVIQLSGGGKLFVSEQQQVMSTGEVFKWKAVEREKSKASAFCQARQAGKSGMMTTMIQNLKEAKLYVSEKVEDLIEDMKGFKWDQRLTLESHPANDETLYYTPYKGNQISLHNGKNWSVNDFPDLPPDGFVRPDSLEQIFRERPIQYCKTSDPNGYLNSMFLASQPVSAQKPPATSFKTEVIHYEDQLGDIQWSIVTVNHPEIDWDPARPLPMGAEWAAKPSSVISGFTWTMLAPTTSFLIAHSTQDCVECAVRLVYSTLYPTELLTGVVTIGSEQDLKLSAIRDLLNENLTVLNTTNVRLKPNSEAVFIW